MEVFVVIDNDGISSGSVVAAEVGDGNDNGDDEDNGGANDKQITYLKRVTSDGGTDKLLSNDGNDGCVLVLSDDKDNNDHDADDDDDI